MKELFLEYFGKKFFILVEKNVFLGGYENISDKINHHNLLKGFLYGNKIQ